MGRNGTVAKWEEKGERERRNRESKCLWVSDGKGEEMGRE